MNAPNPTLFCLQYYTDLISAIRFLTRLPFPMTTPPKRTIMLASWSFPIVGVIVGSFGAFSILLAHLVNIPTVAIALIALLFMAFLTGALHEDGMADIADGFGGGKNRDNKLSIMRDSQIGTFGALTLFAILGLKTIAISALLESESIWMASAAIIATHATARASMVPVAYFLPLASESGLAQSAGKPHQSTVLISISIAVLISLVLLPILSAITATIVSIATTAIIAILAFRQIGGYTGDVLGAVEQSCETTMLITLTAVIA